MLEAAPQDQPADTGTEAVLKRDGSETIFSASPAATEDGPQPGAFPAVLTSKLRERPSPIAITLTTITILFTCIIGILILQFQGNNTIIVMAPSPTPPPPAVTMTPTITPTPPATQPPTLTPTITLTPPPTATLPPPRAHTVSSGETLIGISFLYRVSVESIAAANEISSETAVQVNQNLLIPWPTATPPLVVIAVEVNGELVIADPTGCERYEVQSGDSIAGIAGQFGLQFDILAQVNRITNPDLLRPGDTICIPEIRYGESLPPTPGPTPTATVTRPPSGPTLLYPTQNTVFNNTTQPLTLQWVTVKDLLESEYYMVELSDRRAFDAIIWRGFTRDSAFQVPAHWRPTTPELREMVWRVRIINVTDWRVDGLPIYTFGGESSPAGYFLLVGRHPRNHTNPWLFLRVVPSS